jgi:hypothetical protein
MRASDLRLSTVTETRSPVTGFSGAVDWEATASFTYRLAGFDQQPRSFGVRITVAADAARPGVLAITAWRPSPRPEAWDLAGLRVRRTGDALVLAVGSEAHAEEIVGLARSSARRVRTVWGSAEPAVWVAPGSDTAAALLLGRKRADLEGVAATIDGPLVPGTRAGADRIVIVPGAWRSLSTPGREVVLAHELTHAAVRASTTRPVPLWLSEGFAEYVAYQDVALPEREVVEPALEVVRRSGLPSVLPVATDFDPVGGTLPAAYASSLLVVRSLVAAHGESAVVRLYRDLAGHTRGPSSAEGDAEAVLDRALGAVLSTDRAAVVAGWRSRLRGLLAG